MFFVIEIVSYLLFYHKDIVILCASWFFFWTLANLRGCLCLVTWYCLGCQLGQPGLATHCQYCHSEWNYGRGCLVRLSDRARSRKTQSVIWLEVANIERYHLRCIRYFTGFLHYKIYLLKRAILMFSCIVLEMINPEKLIQHRVDNRGK